MKFTPERIRDAREYGCGCTLAVVPPICALFDALDDLEEARRALLRLYGNALQFANLHDSLIDEKHMKSRSDLFDSFREADAALGEGASDVQRETAD